MTCNVRSGLGWSEGKREKANRRVAGTRSRGDDLTQRAAATRLRVDNLTQRVAVTTLRGGQDDLEGGGNDSDD